MGSQIVGILVVFFAGVPAGLFTTPLRVMHNYTWENCWFIYSVFATLVFPWVLAFLSVPDVTTILQDADVKSILEPMGCGVLWGVGSVTFGLSCHFVGDSLAFAIILGLTSTLGAAIPLLLLHADEAKEKAGEFTWAGLGIVVVGLYFVGKAGMRKEKEQAALIDTPEAELLLGSSSIQGELDDDVSTPAKKSFVFGLVLCFCSGIFSPMLNVGIAFGDKIEDASSHHGASDSMKKNLLWALIVTGGFVANGIYSIYLMQTQKTWGNFQKGTTGQVVHDLLLSILMGFLWISGNVVYGIGATMMGKLGTVAGWPIFMVSMVLTATVVSMVAGDYKGTSNTTIMLLCVGLAILLAATIVVALGS